MFHDMPSIESIIASGNFLYKVEERKDFRDLLRNNEKLKFISLRGNGLHTLSHNFFSGNRLPETIDLALNRIHYFSLNLSAHAYICKQFYLNTMI